MNFKDFRKELARRIRTRYILILRNKENWEDKFSVILTPMNLILIFSGLLVLFSMLILLLLTRTPLREYVYGSSSDGKYKNEYLQMSLLRDSLDLKLHAMELERENLLNIMMGRDSIYRNAPKPDTVDYAGSADFDKVSAEEEELREQLESGEISKMDVIPFSGNNMFTPLQGYLTDTFNLKTRHLAVDIAAPKNSAVKSILNGTVIFSGWTPDNGNVMVIQHANDLISVYKHNSALLKKSGNYVSAGEPVTLVGNTGELSSGYHLHFELWQNGIPVNPRDFIVF